MKKPSVKPAPETQASKPLDKTIKFITILFRSTCPKMTSRGKGDLSYELGIDEETAESYVRISGNDSSGAYSNEWLDLGKIRTLLDGQEKTFSATLMEGLFRGRSTNNHGYLAAILMAEKVLVVLPGKPILLSIGDWEPVLLKIQTLKGKMVSLTDHIAIAARKKAEKKAAKKEPTGQTPAET